MLILLPLLGWGMALQAGRKKTWVEVRSPHFVAYSDAGEAEARQALKGFEGIRSVYGKLFPGMRLDPPKPMIVIVVQDGASMQRFIPQQFEGKDPKRPSGIFIEGPDRNYALLRLDVRHQAEQPYFTLFHEYTHSITYLNFPVLPTWLDEGLADFYGATEIRSDHVYIGRVPLGRLMDLRQSVRLPLPTLLTVTHDDPHYREREQTGIFYAQSWAFVHYLFLDEKALKAGLFQAYVKALAKGKEPLASAQEAFGDLEKLQGELQRYSQSPRFGFWDLPLVVQLTDQDFQARPLEDAEALVIRAEFLQSNGEIQVSQKLLQQALVLAPRLPELHAALGCNLILRGETVQARTAFEEAIRLGSRDFRPPYRLALLAQDSQGSDGDDAATILGWLESARSLRPDFPGIHLALCRQYAVEPRNPEKALREGTTALELDPRNLANLANLGLVCLQLGLEGQAREIGERLGRQAFTESEKRIATSYQACLAPFLERSQEANRAPAPPDASPGHDPTQPRHSQGPPLTFSLPAYFAPLGQEVIQLVSADRINEAIGKVETALASAKNNYDRKVLRTLLETLRKPTPTK
jgi:tetratricopeptide (TPR) repeat protein